MKFGRVFTNLFQFNRTNWKAIILCFLAAAIFWLFSAFNKNHTTTIRFPLQFEFDHQQFVAIKPLPHQISINVRGSGWELFRKTLGIRLPEVIIPVEQPMDIRKLPANALTPLVASQIGGLQINFIVTDTLHIQLDEKKSKTFWIKADISTLTFRDGFGNIGEPKLIPDSVVIDGPKTIIDTIPDTILIPVNGTQISKPLREELEVPLYGSVSVNRNPPVVEVHVTVGRVETIETMIKVRAINQSTAGKSLFTDSVKVLIRIPQGQHEDLVEKLSQINALVDLRPNGSESHQQYPKIIGLPIYAQLVSIDSVSVKIDKRN